MATKILLIAVLFAAAGVVGAQQSNDQYFQEQQHRQQQAFNAEQARQGDMNQPRAQQPAGEWKTTWGAIAADSDKGVIGTVVGQRSESDAGAAAIVDCQSRGGTRCALQLAYFNQCAAMVMGDQEYRVYSAGTVEEAVQRGMKHCDESDRNCRVYYSDCTKPLFIQN